MRRRTFLASVGGAIFAPPTIHACQDSGPGAAYRFVREEDLCGDPKKAGLIAGLKYPAAVLPPDISKIPRFKPPGNRNLVRRKTWSEWKGDEKYAAQLKLAYDALAKSGAKSGLLSQTGFHGKFCCSMWTRPKPGVTPFPADIHNNWYFLPWHRAFLYFHECALRAALRSVSPGDADLFRLPIWDWDTAATIPEFYRELGLPSFLSQGCRRNYFSSAKAFTNYCSLQAWLGSTRFEDFCGSSPDKNSTPVSSQGPHAAFHSLVNGALGDMSYAAADPVFYAHHANVDRFWAFWMKNGGHPALQDWLDIPMVFYDEHNQLVRALPRDFEDHRQLGYDYDLSPLNFDTLAADETTQLVTHAVVRWLELALNALPVLTKVPGFQQLSQSVSRAAGHLDSQAAHRALQGASSLALKKLQDWERSPEFAPPKDRCAPAEIQINLDTHTLTPDVYYLVSLRCDDGHFSNLGGFTVFSHSMQGDTRIALSAVLSFSLVKTVLYALANNKELTLVYGKMATKGEDVSDDFQKLMIEPNPPPVPINVATIINLKKA